MSEKDKELTEKDRVKVVGFIVLLGSIIILLLLLANPFIFSVRGVEIWILLVITIMNFFFGLYVFLTGKFIIKPKKK